MANGTVSEIGAKMDALGLWKQVAPFHWGIRPKGTVFPYFCSIHLEPEQSPVKVRFMLLEGWKTFHDFVRTRLDANFGFYSTPMEMPHFELVVLKDGALKAYRHDPGYVPVEVAGSAADLCAKMLWQAYGVMLRVEADPRLPLRFSDEKAMFSRVEDAAGDWRDEPLPILDPGPYVEKVSFERADLAKAKDLPLVADFTIELDFGLVRDAVTREARPRCAYRLAAVDAATGEKVLWDLTSVDSEHDLKELWEGMPVHFLKRLVELGRVPGEVKVRSGRVFRFLRVLCPELPLKLSMHDSLPALAKILV